MIPELSMALDDEGRVVEVCGATTAHDLRRQIMDVDRMLRSTC